MKNDGSDVITLAETAAIADYLSYLFNELGIASLAIKKYSIFIIGKILLKQH
jgi:glutathione S-transferase